MATTCTPAFYIEAALLPLQKKLKSLADSLVNCARAIIRRSNLLHSFHFLPHIFRHSSFLLLLSWENICDNCIEERKPRRKNERFCPKCSVTKGKCRVAIFGKLFVVKETFDKNAFRKRFKKRSEKITTEKILVLIGGGMVILP